MKFYTETILGDLILIKTNAPMPLLYPIIAQSVKPGDALIIRFVLWLAVLIAPLIPHYPPQVWTNNKARFAILTIVIVVAVEVLAQNHIERAWGAMAC